MPRQGCLLGLLCHATAECKTGAGHLPWAPGVSLTRFGLFTYSYHEACSRTVVQFQTRAREQPGQLC